MLTFHLATTNRLLTIGVWVSTHQWVGCYYSKPLLKVQTTTQITWLRLLLLLIFILRHLRGLGQLQVILALLAHAVGVGAATILPLHTDPAVLPQLSNHTAQAWRRPVLKEALDTLTALHIMICVRLLKETLDTLTALRIMICIRLLKEALDTLTALHIIICIRLLKEALNTLTALHIMIWVDYWRKHQINLLSLGLLWHAVCSCQSSGLHLPILYHLYTLCVRICSRLLKEVWQKLSHCLLSSTKLSWSIIKGKKDFMRTSPHKDLQHHNSCRWWTDRPLDT